MRCTVLHTQRLAGAGTREILWHKTIRGIYTEAFASSFVTTPPFVAAGRHESKVGANLGREWKSSECKNGKAGCNVRREFAVVVAVHFFSGIRLVTVRSLDCSLQAAGYIVRNGSAFAMNNVAKVRAWRPCETPMGHHLCFSTGRIQLATSKGFLQCADLVTSVVLNDWSFTR